MKRNEISKHFQVDINSFRKYEENGFLRHQVLADETFDDTEAELHRAGLIRFLLRTGLDMVTVKRYLELLDGNRQNCEEQVRILRKQRYKLLDDIHDKQQLLDGIDYLICEINRQNHEGEL